MSDPVEELLFSNTDQVVLKSEEAEDTPIFEGSSTALTNLKIMIWLIAVVLLLAPLINLQGVRTNWPIVSAVCAAALGMAICVQLIPDRSFVRLYRNKIEWRRWGEAMETADYSIRMARSDMRIVIENSEGKLIGLLPQLAKADVIDLLAVSINLGVPIKLPSEKSWLQASLGIFTYETYQINWLRIAAMTLPGVGFFGALSIAFVTSLPVSIWILPLPVSLIVAFVLGKTAKKLTSRNRFEISGSTIKKVGSGKTVWSVDVSEIRHIGFAAQSDICRFVLVTHYGRRYTLPSAWNVVLPFALWRRLKLVKDEEMQAELEKPISFKKTGL